MTELGQGYFATWLDNGDAGEFVAAHHYAHAPGATVYSMAMRETAEHDVDPYGNALLFPTPGRLVGVATYGRTVAPNAAAICGPEWQDHVLELTRFVLLDEVPRNGESWFLGQTFRLLETLDMPLILISYADTAHGHRGVIYQATNWRYTGVSTQAIYVDAAGRHLHDRTIRDPRKGRSAASAARAGLSLTRELGKPKHRYVRFIGSRKDQALFRESLRWQVLPHPKVIEAVA